MNRTALKVFTLSWIHYLQHGSGNGALPCKRKAAGLCADGHLKNSMKMLCRSLIMKRRRASL